MIYCTRKTTKQKTNTKTYIKYRSLKNYTPEVLVGKLKSIDFPDYSTYENVNEGYTDLIDKINKVIDEIAPIKEMCVKNNTEEWVDEDVLEGIRIRDKKFTKFKKTRLHIDDINYRKARNHLQKLIRKKKRNYITTKLNENIGKPKELWKSLKSLGLPSKKGTPSKICLEKEGKVSFDPKTNVEILKDFYSNLATDLVNKLPRPTNKFGMNSVKEYYKSLNLENKNFSFQPTTEENVLKLLKDIDPAKAVGLDNLAGRFLKDGAPELSIPITKLINLSILKSVFPEQCKIAKLKPLFKKGSNLEPKNYRPISLLPLISKLFEKIIQNQTQKYLDENNILYRYQSGFRKSHSTDTCLLLLNDKILTGIDNGMLTGMILIDLQKAFDTIDHGIFF